MESHLNKVKMLKLIIMMELC